MTISYNDKCHNGNHKFIVTSSDDSTVDEGGFPTTDPDEIFITYKNEWLKCTVCNGIYSSHSKVYS